MSTIGESRDDSGVADALFAEWAARVEGGERLEFKDFVREHAAHAVALEQLHADWQLFAPILGRVVPGLISSDSGIVMPSLGGPDADEDAPSRELLARLGVRSPNEELYRFRAVIGRGGGGVVLKVWDTKLNRPLAMKVVLGRGEDRPTGETPKVDGRTLTRFVDEARIAGQLNHPGIAPVHELGADETGRAFFTMKLVMGEDLSVVFEHVRTGKDGWNQARALGVLLKVCEAMSYAHDKGVIHRDLKPANVMVGKFGEVYVMDWGLAHVRGREDRHDLRVRSLPESTLSAPDTGQRAKRGETTDSPLVTMDGDVVGTPSYMPPEQARGQLDQLGPHCDVYSVGAMLYHLLSGQMPYVSKGAKLTPRTVLMSVLNGPPRPIEELTPRAPAELVSICEKAMAREVALRYPNMQAMAVDLRAFFEGRVVKAYETGAAAEFKKWVKRNKGMAAAIAAAALSVAAGLGGISAVQASANTKLKGANTQLSEANKTISATNAQLSGSNTQLTTANAELKEARNEATANEAKAAAALADWQRLADMKRLEDYTSKASALWPALPEKVAAMQDWLSKAKDLVTRLPQHKTTLGALRAQALPYTEEDKKLDRDTYPWSEELAELVKAREYWTSLAANPPPDSPDRPPHEQVVQLAKLDARIANLEKELSERRTWKFTDTDQQSQHDMLSGLVAGITTLADEDPAVGTIADVQERFEFARTVEKKTLVDARSAWDAAIASIADRVDCPKYNGLILKPQIGLVPIGKDPQSGLWEFAHLATGEAPTRGADGKLELTTKTGLVFVLLPGGTFHMGAEKPTAENPLGSPNVDPQAEDDETEGKEIALDPFFLSKYEMTQAQWVRATRRNPSLYVNGGRTGGGQWVTALNPVEHMSWEDCNRALRRLALELPTEAQWEYGDRGGTTTVWWTGDTVESLQGAANLADAYALKHGGSPMWEYEEKLDDGNVVHAPIGSYRPNGYGLHDTVGNVCEWCQDFYGDDYNEPARPGDGLRSLAGAASRVDRGGGFDQFATLARSAKRGGGAPEDNSGNLGVRPARMVTP